LQVVGLFAPQPGDRPVSFWVVAARAAALVRRGASVSPPPAFRGRSPVPVHLPPQIFRHGPALVQRQEEHPIQRRECLAFLGLCWCRHGAPPSLPARKRLGRRLMTTPTMDDPGERSQGDIGREGIAVAYDRPQLPSPRRQGRRAAIPATWRSSPPSAGRLSGNIPPGPPGGWELPDCRPLLRSFGPQNLSWGTTQGELHDEGKS
jgi:hypothetical protein